MSLISISLPSDGTTADVADLNTPLNTITNEFNGNIDNANIKSAAAIDGSKLADASITNAKLSTASGEVGGAWASWTPTLTGATVGNGTLNCAYKQIGKTYHCRFSFILGSTSAITGTFKLTTPVTMVTLTQFLAIGTANCTDQGVADYLATVGWDTAGTVIVLPYSAAGSYATANFTSSTVPFTWGSTDKIHGSFTFEAA